MFLPPAPPGLPAHPAPGPATRQTLRRQPPARRNNGLLSLLLMAAAAAPAGAAPLTVPADDLQIVERLPLRWGDRTSARAEREQRRQLQAQPQNLPLALQRARQALMRECRGIDYDGVDRSLDVRVGKLRQRLGDTEPHRFVKTVRGVGYQLAVER